MLQNNIFVVNSVVLDRFIIILMAYLLYVHNPPTLVQELLKKADNFWLWEAVWAKVVWVSEE